MNKTKIINYILCILVTLCVGGVFCISLKTTEMPDTLIDLCGFGIGFILPRLLLRWIYSTDKQEEPPAKSEEP